MPTKAKGKSRFWRKCRIYFRRFRLTVWLVTLAMLGALVYLNQIGLPDFLKRPLLARLQERGVALDFSALRLHWSRGFVAEQVRFGATGATNDPAVPQLTAQELEINLHLRALLRAKVQVDSIAMRGGRLEWTLAETNAPGRTLNISTIDTSLRFLPDDRWMLDDLRGRFAGADFFLSGALTNASALRDWEPARLNKKFGPSRSPEQLRKLAQVLERISFRTPPEVRLIVTGDARDLGSFEARLAVKAADADTAWGQARQVYLTARIVPVVSNELSRVEINLQAQSAETKWASAINLDIKVRLLSAGQQPDLVDAAVTFRAGLVETPWAIVGNPQLKASWQHTVTNPIPRAARVELHADAITTWLTRALNFDFAATLTSVPNPIAADPALGFWTNLLPYQVQWSTTLGTLRNWGLQADRLACEGEWAAPLLSISDLQAALYRGALAGQAKLNVVTRAVALAGQSDFDFKRLAPLLPKMAEEWLAKFTWGEAPRVSGAAALVLPAWTNRPADWLAEVAPTLRLAGHAALTNVAYEGMHADWARTQFSYTNQVWRLPDFTLGRPEGEVQVSHIANLATRDYYFKFHSAIDPQVVMPLLGPEVRRGFDLSEFGQPPVLEGELWGRGRDPASLGFQGRVALTNFSFRGQTTDVIVSGLNYTNLVLACLEPRIWRGTQSMSAAGITADFITRRTYFTNGFSTLDPGVVVRAIGPMVTRVMAPYHFGQPPVARFNGYTSMGNPHDANVTFEGEGDDFESLNFRVPHYTARVIWKNNLLTVTNVQGDFYEGKASGWAHFIFPDEYRAEYTFTVNVTNARLPLLVADVTQKKNNLDGLLTGQLVITNAWTDSIYSWQGYGQARLQDGLLWELPIFGVLSRPLESIMPGVANSRFSEASGTFDIGNSVIRSENLEMRSPAMRLQYRGGVSFDGLIKARVIAEPLRDTPVVGSIVSTVLWPVAKLFAYKISGTLSDPKSEPVYIPKLLMIPFSPFQSLGDLFAPVPAKTNAPAEIK